MLRTCIVAVGNDRQCYDTLRRQLQGEGYTVELVESAEEAFQLIAVEPPDLVLTDLHMADVDGIGLCRALLAHSPGLPVIVLTDVADPSAAVSALRAGAEDYLTKPVHFDELLFSIHRAIERRAARVERQQLRQRADELRFQALAAVEAHREILSVVAHDLRTPLGVIALWAQHLTRSPGPRGDTSQLGLAAISRNATRMQRLIGDLLDESRIRTGHLPLERAAHPLSALLADVSELRPLAQQKRVSLVTVPPNPERLLSCDRGRMNQVLGNLVANAIKFSKPGSTVTVSAEDDGDGVLFAVRDEGPGIEEDALPLVFDRFWQVKTSGQAGVGLGLYIVKSIVELHGGRVWVESRPGQGATFKVFLPGVVAGSDCSQDSARLHHAPHIPEPNPRS